MEIQIHDEPLSHLADHGLIAGAFTVDRVLDLTVEEGGLGGFRLRERPLTESYVKDYDMVVGNRPEDWRRQFDLSSWGLISARIAGQRVGGVVIAAKSRELHLLEGRDDLALLWDIRVAPSVRRRGIGATLFAAAERWAGGRGCLQLKVETQNTNVAACKFYASRGCELGAVQRFAYPDFPAEIQLLWYKVLGNRE